LAKAGPLCSPVSKRSPVLRLPFFRALSWGPLFRLGGLPWGYPKVGHNVHKQPCLDHTRHKAQKNISGSATPDAWPAHSEGMDGTYRRCPDVHVCRSTTAVLQYIFRHCGPHKSRCNRENIGQFCYSDWLIANRQFQPSIHRVLFVVGVLHYDCLCTQQAAGICVQKKGQYKFRIPMNIKSSPV
jgi:hypothetical protein